MALYRHRSIRTHRHVSVSLLADEHQIVSAVNGGEFIHKNVVAVANSLLKLADIGVRASGAGNEQEAGNSFHGFGFVGGVIGGGL